MARSSRIVIMALAWLAVGVQARAADPEVPIGFDHLGTNVDLSYPVALKSAQPFAVTISNTCEPQFDYRMFGVQAAPPVAPPVAAAAVPVQQLTTKTLRSEYDPKFGSYRVQITRKDGGTPCFQWRDANERPVTPPAAALNDVTFMVGGAWHRVDELNEVDLIVAVTPVLWEVGQDAALTIVPQAIRKFTTTPTSQSVTTDGVTTTVTKYKVGRDEDGEDVARFTFATLTHFYAPGRNHGLALGFGLVDNKAEYYFGWSWGLGPRNNRVLNIAAGAVLTPVGMLPMGVHEDDLLDQATIGGEFRNVHRIRPFVALTATFFRSREDRSEKPEAPPQ